jgi:hypothetical protein
MDKFTNMGSILEAFEQNQPFEVKLDLFRGWAEAVQFVADNLVISDSDKSQKLSEESRFRGNELFKKGALRPALGSHRHCKENHA